MNTTIQDELIASVSTTRDKSMLVGELTRVRARVFDADAGELQRVLSSEVRGETAEKLQLLLAEAQSAEARDQLLLGLIDGVRNLPQLQLTLAIVPTKVLETRVSEYVLAEVGKKVVVNYTYDPGIMGGAVVAYDGKYLEYSVKQIFDAMSAEEEKVAMGKLSGEKIQNENSKKQ